MKNAAFLAVTLFLLFIFSSGCLIADLDEELMKELMDQYENKSDKSSPVNDSIYIGKTNKRAPPPLPEQ
jgi:hypothetical protein